MFSIVTTYYMTTYIAFYIALQFAFFSFFSQDRKLYLYFSFMTVCAAIFQYSIAQYYQAVTFDQVVSSIKMQSSIAIILLVSIYIFISSYTNTPIKKSFFIFLTFLTILGLYENFISPYGLRFESITSSIIVILPWGEHVTNYYGSPGPLFNILRFILVIILIWGIWRAKVHFASNKYESVLLILFFIIFLASIAIGTLIDLQYLKFVYIAGFAYFFLVISMTFSLGQRNFSDRKKLEFSTNRLLEENSLRMQAEEDLLYRAHHDELTGLPNRRVIMTKLEESIQQANRSFLNIAVLFIDLDHFKDINDSLGHNIGDEVLIDVSQKILHCIRKTDHIARLGGDEFCVVIPSFSSDQEATSLAMKIIETLQQPTVIAGHELYVGCSIGISTYPSDGQTPLELLRNSDSAMYKAKVDRNSFQFYTDDMTHTALERISMETHLRQALSKNEFIVYYQAQVNATTGALTGVEALVRWNHPTLGLVPPTKFIPIAEEIGLIIYLDRWVMQSAMTQLHKWYTDGFNPGILALNLSVKELQKNDFLSTIDELLRDTKCQPQWLEMEATEGRIMKSPDECIAVLKQISDKGIQIAIDDFGTGYSSLSYLKRLPINKLKIDKSFIDGLPDDEEDASICKAIIALAKSLKLSTIAEGVETIQQRDFLLDNGCENIQGYLYSKPIPADEFEHIFLK
jgi:diguanylate cyclase (GGDEF)-like protein